MAGENMTFPMPTEKLKTEIEDLRRKLQFAESALRAAELRQCPDPNCLNCKKWKNWEFLNGDVDWKVCQTCQAGVGEPCRRAWVGGGGSYAQILRHPHRGRPGELRGPTPGSGAQ